MLDFIILCSILGIDLIRIIPKFKFIYNNETHIDLKCCDFTKLPLEIKKKILEIQLNVNNISWINKLRAFRRYSSE